MLEDSLVDAAASAAAKLERCAGILRQVAAGETVVAGGDAATVASWAAGVGENARLLRSFIGGDRTQRSAPPH